MRTSKHCSYLAIDLEKETESYVISITLKYQVRWESKVETDCSCLGNSESLEYTVWTAWSMTGFKKGDNYQGKKTKNVKVQCEEVEMNNRVGFWLEIIGAERREMNSEKAGGWGYVGLALCTLSYRTY